MAETTGLTGVFNSFAKHIFSPTMLIMMTAMAFPAVGAAAASLGTGATFGDIGLATVDMYGSMFTAPFTDGGVIGDAFANAAEGNWAAQSYEFGMMDHGAHITHAASGVVDLTDEFAGWIDGLSTEQIQDVANEAAEWGMSIPEYYQSL